MDEVIKELLPVYYNLWMQNYCNRITDEEFIEQLIREYIKLKEKESC